MRKVTAASRFVVCFAALWGVMSAAPAAAEAKTCGILNQYHPPIFAKQGPCITAGVGFFWVDATGQVTGGPAVACTLYTRVWRNHTLIANSVRKCDSSLQATYYSPHWSAPTGTRVTAQTFFDVRYRVSGGGYRTERFESNRVTDTVI